MESSHPQAAMDSNFISIKNNNLYNVLNKEIKQEITVKIEEVDPEDFETDLIRLEHEDLSNLYNKQVESNNELYKDHIIKNELLVIGPEKIQTTSNDVLNSMYRSETEPKTRNESTLYSESYPKMLELPNDTNPKNMCKFCHKPFTKKSNLNRHQNYHCRLNTAKKENNKRLKYGLYPHPFICDYCQKTFTHKNTLITHIRTHPDGALSALKYKCKVCSKEYTKKHNLTCHMKSTHLNIKSYSCAYCPYKFAWRWALVSHEKSRHENILSNNLKWHKGRRIERRTD